MTVETFFEKFEAMTQTPRAIGRLRALILSLATLGKLVPQVADDEPAAELVVKIQAALDGLRAKKQTTVEPIDSENLPVLPATWKWVRLGNVVEYGSPDKVDSKEIEPRDWLLDLEDIEKDTSRLLQKKTFGDSPSLSTKTRFKVGDVLYGKLRPYLNKVLVADAKGYCTTEIIPIRAHGFIDPNYLCYALKRPDFIAYAVSKCYGMNLPRLGTDDARLAPFPLPPLAEQKRIVTKLDELMALCDRLEAQQKEREAKHAVLARAALARFAAAPTPSNLKYLFHPAYAIDSAELRRSILLMAVQGRLVSTENIDPDILIDDARDYGLFDIPTHWTWRKLGSLLVDGPTNGISPKAVARETPVRSLTLTATTSGRFRGEHFKYLGVDIPDDSDLWLKDGDILVQRGNTREYVGVAAVYRGGDRQFVYPDLMMRIRFKESVLPEYAHVAMSAEPCRDFLRTHASGTTGTMPKINQTTLKALPVPLPPLAEQRRIVAKFDQLMALVDRLEAQLAESRAVGERLMEAVVAELTAAEPATGEAAADAELTSAAISISEPERTAAEPALPILVGAKPETFDLFGQPDQSERYLRNAITVVTLVIGGLGKGNGKTFIEKNLHLVESFCDVPMGRKPQRMAHGPADLKQHDNIMDEAAEAEIFLSEHSSEGQRVHYVRGDLFDDTVLRAGEVLGDKLRSVKMLIAKLRPLSSRNAEWVATVYGSWNDFIKDGIATPSDKQIIDDIYKNWHVTKQEVPEKEWRWALSWLRENNIIPNGKGPRVVAASSKH